MRITTVFAAFSIVTPLLLVAGCYESAFTLGPESRSVFEPAYLGDWRVVSGGVWADTHLVIRRWDDHTYYVEWGKRSEAPLRMSGFVIDVKGASFAHLRAMREDMGVPDKFLIFRVAIVDGQLSIRPLDGKFFERKPVNSSEQFRKLVEENLDNDKMYDKDGSASAIRTSGLVHEPNASAGNAP